MNTDIQPVQDSLDGIINHSQTRLQLVNLDHLSLIKVEGADAHTFLQGQFSNDLDQIRDQAGQLNAYCTPKGRALAIFQLFKDDHDNSYWMLLPKDISEPLVNRLKMFVMRAKVTFSVLPGDQFAGVLGSDANFPEKDFIRHSVNGIVDRTLLIRLQLPISLSDYSETVLSGDYWKLVDIESGIPQVYSQTSESFIPQNVNLDLIDGVSFRKGCYPGQEIVARLKYLGKSKQRLAIARLSDVDRVEPGMSIYSDEKPEQKSGVVVDAVKIADGTYRISAMLPTRPSPSTRFYPAAGAEAVMELLPLPYEIPED